MREFNINTKNLLYLFVLTGLICGLIFVFISAGYIKRYDDVVNDETRDEQTSIPFKDGLILDLSNYKEELAAKDSDIDGWTMLDKYNAGLNPEDGSDTDSDGLTDKEEIEVYGTNPLASSTAGDLYYDSEKVEMGLGLFTYYDYEGEFPFLSNEQCDSITFIPATPSDRWAVAKDWSNENIACTGYSILKVYDIYNLDGEFVIDVSNFIKSGYALEDFIIFKTDWYNVVNNSSTLGKYEIADSLIYDESKLIVKSGNREDNKAYIVAVKAKK